MLGRGVRCPKPEAGWMCGCMPDDATINRWRKHSPFWIVYASTEQSLQSDQQLSMFDPPFVIVGGHVWAAGYHCKAGVRWAIQRDFDHRYHNIVEIRKERGQWRQYPRAHDFKCGR